MNEAASKQQILDHIREGLSDAENGIKQHPPETSQIYEQGKAAFRKGQDGSEHPEWAIEKGLTPEELRLMHDYLFATSFISAWFHSQGDKARRDTAAQSASLLVVGLGFPPEDVMKRLVEYEQNWRGPMRASGIGGKKTGCLPVLIAGVFVGSWVVQTLIGN